MAGRGMMPEQMRGGINFDELAAMQTQYGGSVQEHILELQARVGALRRDNALLLTQLARAAKCLSAVSSENQLLKTEVASLQPAGGGNQDPMRR
ncbi:hypothetical protein CHLRE_03g204000v5 [Chlamydomonas reinhardtii]|uniref:Uncharacterized protein n=1 Tax=Chlamydomonas reinhardtii TaxID=3055 RepID=A0A2K3DZ55_CHLRE|nr:uncharacterized protein CHLRE_03g204000v5 [Chlamydomonas reinhardtii]PNW85820.1 hypothetical protein CHLRE_03g204000v5 [Chlamydomonas reinhardtii]